MSTVAGGLKAASKAAPQKKSKIVRFLKLMFWVGLAAASIFAITFVLVLRPRLMKAAGMIPNLGMIMEQISSQPSEIVSDDGTVLYSMQGQFRRPVTIEEVPQVVINATLAAEDKRFFEHGGVDFVTFTSIGLQTMLTGSVPRGGSTLTMQIAKRVYTSPVQTMDRKLDDMALAMQIERKLTKYQILELYLNQVYYGKRAYGISAAADVYFGKTLDQLTISEAAMLARLVRRPSDENPFDNMEVAIKNRNVVLSLMLDEKMITEREYYDAKAEEPKLAKERPQTVSGKKNAPYFVDAVLRELKKDFPDVDFKMGGYRIETTLNWELEKYAEEVVAKAVRDLKGQKVTTAAMFLMDNDGAVLVHIGGDEYDKNQFDVITQGARQPGSAFKPFVYATAFDRGLITPYSEISNEVFYWPTQYGPPKMVHNSDGKYGGNVTVEYALMKSMNVPAARVMVMTGPGNVVALAKNGFGFQSQLAAVPALALGSTAVSPLEMARAYSVFKNKGNRVEPYFIRRVIGPDGSTVKRYVPQITKNAVNGYTAGTLDTLLYKNAHNGTGFRVSSEQGVVNGHGKTGTTNDFRDAWFCGYTDRFVGIGWVGSEVRKGDRWVYQEMNRVFGGTAVAPFWGKIVKRAQDTLGESAVKFSGTYENRDIEIDVNPGDRMFEELPGTDAPAKPPTGDGATAGPPVKVGESNGGEPERSLDIVYAEVCADTGALATAYCPEKTRKPYLKGSEPKNRCPIHVPPH